jgi:flotillin
MELLFGAGVLVILGIAVVAFVLSRMKVVPQTHAMIVSGSRNADGPKVIKPGGRAFIIPVIQNAELVPLGQINVALQVGGVDSNKIPVEVTGVAMVKVKQDEKSIRDAAERFGSAQNFSAEIAKNLQQVLTGSLRSAIATMTVDDLLVKREILAKSVREATESEVAVMGLGVDSMQVFEIMDKNGYIEALGAREAEKVKAEARIAQAEYDQQANDKEITSQQAIADRTRDLDLRKSILKAETDRAAANASAAGPLAKAEQDRAIAQLQQETAEQEAILRERQLEIEVKKPADAEKYRVEQESEARKRTAILNAEADAERIRLSAEADAQQVNFAAEAEANRTKLIADAEAGAVTARAVADAESVRVKGDAQASSVSAIGAAEASAMDAKAEAYEKYGEAAVIQLLIEKAPEIARELAAPMGNIDKLTVISTDGASALPKAVANNFSQLDDVIGSLTGTKLTDLISGLGKGKVKEVLAAINSKDVTPTI